MCGIAGIFHLSTPKPVDPARIERMCAAMAHRGPDGQGVWTAPGVGLGHLRLSIIDLAGSPQPMASSDGRAMLVFNGEIYNYRELREELRASGATFHTDGDSEVILAAWQKWGPACLPRLHGMFAFAIYDLEARTLFMARDRLGVKPLFYAPLSDGSLAFASKLAGDGATALRSFAVAFEFVLLLFLALQNAFLIHSLDQCRDIHLRFERYYSNA